MIWPPNYTVRHSTRAKRISMRIIPDKGLEIVLPKRFSERDALKFLNQHKDWVLKHQDLLSSESIQSEQDKYKLLDCINLPCIEKSFQVSYNQQSNRNVLLIENTTEIMFFGRIRDFRDCEHAYYEWLKRIGKRYLIPMLDTLSHETGFSYQKVSIRNQSTRWGSCSEEGNISLNAKLLLQPYEVARYVIIHELCHLRELNHSKAFWALVARFEPRYKVLKRQLQM